MNAGIVAGLFFPQRIELGFDSRELTPQLCKRIVFAAAEARSFKRAAVVLWEVADCQVSAKTIERVAHEVGQELATEREQNWPSEKQPAEPPKLAVIQVDGGRIRVRQAGCGPGVHEAVWRESKNACLVRMTSSCYSKDPHPTLPRAFQDAHHVAEIAGIAAPEEVEAIPSWDPIRTEDYRPKRLVRTCLSSLVCSEEFGGQIYREALHRGFDQAQRKAYLGDGLPYNWSIQQQHFRDYVPILDFVHVLEYLYPAGMAMADEATLGWQQYLRLAEACWQGQVANVITEFDTWLDANGWHEDLPEEDPRHRVAHARRYLTNNQTRMKYPEYRCQGLPVTSALAESLIKEINWRVKGSEMFWNNPDGAEAILQIRAAALCDTSRLTHYLAKRQGCQHHRRSSGATAA